MSSDGSFPASFRRGLPAFEHLEIAVRPSRPSLERWPVLSDVADLGPGRAGLVQGEVRCVRAGTPMLPSDVLTLAREWLGRAPDDLVLCARELNRGCSEALAHGGFVTLFLGLYEDDTRALAYVNAGHDAPVLRRRDGTTDRLPVIGAPLGMMVEFPFESGRVRFGAGDLLVLIADFMTYGVMGPKSYAEAANEPEASEVIESAVRALEDTSPERVIQSLLAQVSMLRRGGPTDDVELMVARAR